MPADAQALQTCLGRVGNQPISVSSFTNKRMTVNFRAPVERLRRLVPPPIEVEEIRDTGMGMISMCVCDFSVTKFGIIPVPKIAANEMLCRIAVTIPKDMKTYRAYYTLRSDTSSRLLGLLGGRFSHFRKAVSTIEKRDGDGIYELRCKADDDLCSGYFRGYTDSLTKTAPPSTLFADIEEATDFVFEVDGSCGYSFPARKFSFQKIKYPNWDLSFCTRSEYDFSLMNHLFDAFDLKAEFDSTLFMENVPQVWGHSWLYPSNRCVMPQAASAGASD